MNYIAQLNRFWQLRREVTFSSTEADLYFYLLEISNGLNWKNPFQQSNKLIEATLDVSEKTLIAARNRLKQHGLIDFTPGVKRSPTTYHLVEAPAHSLEKFQPIPVADEYTGKIPAHPGAIREESGGQSGENSPDITKHKLNKEENTADADSPSSLGQSISSSNPAQPKPAARPKKAKADPGEVAALPLPHPSAEFADLWTTFRTGPQHAKKALSAFEMMLKKLGKYPEAFALVMLESAIQGGWSGVENAGTARAFAEWQAEQARRPSPLPATPPASFDPNALFGYSQSAAAGLARARLEDPDYARYLAEEAAAADSATAQAA